MPQLRDRTRTVSDGALARPDPPWVLQGLHNEHGHPKSYEDVFDRLVKELVKEEKMDVASAERAAEERMSGLPAWTEE